LCDTEAHVGALRPSQATALRPIDAVVVPNTSNTKENEIKPLVTTSKPLSTEATSSESATAQRRRSTSLQELGALPRRSRPTWWWCAGSEYHGPNGPLWRRLEDGLLRDLFCTRIEHPDKRGRVHKLRFLRVIVFKSEPLWIPPHWDPLEPAPAQSDGEVTFGHLLAARKRLVSRRALLEDGSPGLKARRRWHPRCSAFTAASIVTPSHQASVRSQMSPAWTTTKFPGFMFFGLCLGSASFLPCSSHCCRVCRISAVKMVIE